MASFPTSLSGLLLLAMPITAAAGQGVKEIPSRPMCPDCRLVVDTVASIGRASDPVALSHMVFERVALGGAGQFFVAPVFDVGSIAAFDSTGTFERTYGRPGEGPGEFQPIMALTSGPGDTIWVFQVGRLSRLSPAGTIAFVSNYSMGRVWDVESVAEGLFVLSAEAHGADRIGIPLHLMASDGSVVWSGGSEEGIWRADRPISSIFHLSRGTPGTFWAAPVNRYEVTQWDTNGNSQGRIRRTAEWFEPWEDFKEGEPYSTRPNPRFLDIWTDTDGLLWTMVLVADAHWSPMRERPGIGDLSLQDRVFDTIVEIIDPDQGDLIASFRYPEVLSRFLDDGSVVRISQDAMGVVVITLVRLKYVE